MSPSVLSNHKVVTYKCLCDPEISARDAPQILWHLRRLLSWCLLGNLIKLLDQASQITGKLHPRLF
jgi:hypothetical protein